MGIFNVFIDQLDDEKLCTGYFQQDFTTCHTTNLNIKENLPWILLWKSNNCKVLQGQLNLPHRISSYDACWKEKMYFKKPRAPMHMKDNIWQEIDAVTPHILAEILCIMKERVQACLSVLIVISSNLNNKSYFIIWVVWFTDH